MRATIDAPFATAKDTADLLGVPTSRLKKLISLMNSPAHKRNGTYSAARTLRKESSSLKFKASARVQSKAGATKAGEKPAKAKGHEEIRRI